MLNEEFMLSNHMTLINTRKDEMLRDCLDPWLQSLRVDWAAQCNVVSEMMCHYREGCEADLSKFVMGHLHLNMPHLLARAEVPVRVCADGRKAETHGRADIVCIDADQIVVIELKRHPLVACGTDTLENFVNEANDHRCDLISMGMDRLRAFNTAELADFSRAVSAQPLEHLHVLHAANNARMNVLWEVESVIRVGGRINVVRSARGVVNSALDQAANYAASIRADGFHPSAGLQIEISKVFSVAVCVFGETMIIEWN